MTETPHRYELFRGDELLGIVEHVEDDFPWHVGTIEPFPAFAPVKALFDQETKLLSQGSSAEWRALRDQLDGPGLRLVGAAGITITKPLLHIEEERVWWR